MKVAVLDLGSSSFKLAVYRGRAGEPPRRLERRRELVRLAAGLSADGRITAPAWDRAVEAYARLHKLARRRADRVVAVATSAIRDAKNGAELCAELERRHGVAIEILSGHEEAHHGFHGALAMLDEPGGRRAVIELGGGSAQLTAGDARGCRVAASLPIGVLRLRGLDDDALRGQVADAIALAARAVRGQRPRHLILSGGTARRLARLATALGIDTDHGARLDRAALATLAIALPGLGPRDLEALGVAADRQDTLRPGALILDTLLERVGHDAARVSPGGMREGVALRELAYSVRCSISGGRAKKAFLVGSL